jgi:hypothetical protein
MEHLLDNTLVYKTGNVRIKAKLMGLREAIVALEEQ